MEKQKPIKKQRAPIEGQVVGVKMNKTISVAVNRYRKDQKYGRYVRKKVVFKAHDEKNQAKKGDPVLIFETKPISKTKRWRLGRILSKQEAGR